MRDVGMKDEFIFEMGGVHMRYRHQYGGEMRVVMMERP